MCVEDKAGLRSRAAPCEPGGGGADRKTGEGKKAVWLLRQLLSSETS